MAEISKLRTDALNHGQSNNTLTMAHNEIDKLQLELSHQRDRYDDLQRANQSLERSLATTQGSSAAATASRGKGQVTWDDNGSKSPRRGINRAAADNSELVQIELNGQLESLKVYLSNSKAFEFE